MMGLRDVTDIADLDEFDAAAVLIAAVEGFGLARRSSPLGRVPPAPFPRREALSRKALNVKARAVSDAASKVDVLRFEPLVHGLYELVNDEHTTLPLALAVTAPWGAGKSTVMLQLRELLEQREENPTWHTVQFPAWKYESSERLWAALAKAIYDQPQRSMSYREQLLFRVRLERLRKGYRAPLSWLAAFATAAIALVGAFATDFPTIFGGVGAVAAPALVLATRYAGIVSDPFRRAIESYVAQPDYADQLGFTAKAEQDVSELTNALTVAGEQHLAVFVDDLDRCSPKSVVEVVEAINQIFNSAEGTPTVFVLGMDREIVAASIEVAYRATVGHLRRTRSRLARNFGANFLAKIVQMSVAIPEPDEASMDRLLRHVVSGASAADGPDSGLVDELRETIRAGAPRNPADVESVVEQIAAEHPDIDLDALQAAKRRERAKLLNADSDDVAWAERRALRFLPRNPRQVKRFDNAFRLQLQVASGAERGDLEFQRDELEALGKWVAIRLRWPDLAQALDERDELLAELERLASQGDQSGWLADDELRGLLAQPGPDGRISTLLPAGSFLRVA
jgi:hypothetical protein